ncbi:MAG: tetratricopeptide repeat protein [Acidobacteria bacterium]|nr:tetratricopeptide repeat protein [Acidobacteriota bacterium]
MRRGGRLVELGDPEAALAAYQRAAAAFEEGGRDLAIALGGIARIKVQKGEVEDALALHEQRLEAFRALGDKRSAAVTLGDIARIKAQKGEVEEALALNERRLVVARELGDVEGIASTQWDLGQLELLRGSVELALPRLAEAWSHLTRTGRVDALAVVGSTFGQVLLSVGAMDEAQQVLSVASQCWRKLGQDDEAQKVEALLAHISALEEDPIRIAVKRFQGGDADGALARLAELVAEAEEEAPTLVVTIADASGAVVRRLRVEPKAGLQRVAWDLRWPAATPARLAEPPRKNAYDFPARGPLAAPGRYTATLAKRVDGVTTPLGEPRTFEVVPAGAGALPAADRAVLGRFVAETAALQRAALGASSLAGETAGRLVLLARALDDAGAGAEPVRARVAAAVGHLREIRKSLEGDSELARRSIAQAPALLDRINHAVAAHYSSIAAPTGTARRQVELASTELGAVIDALRRLVESDLPALEAEADRLGAPWTPGRVPVWPPAASPNS